MDDLDLMSIIVAGACHDHEHPGFNNVYLVDMRDDIAIRYNGKSISYSYYIYIDQSVLENHHIASSFSVMKSDPKYNIHEKMSKEDYKKSR